MNTVTHIILKRKRETWQMVILAYQARVFIYLSLVHKALCFFHRWSMSSDNLTKSWFTGVSAKAVGKLFRMTRILFFLVWRAPWVVLESTRLLRLSEANPMGKWIEIHLFLKIFGRQHFSETKVASGNWTSPREEGWNPPLRADVVRAGFQVWCHSLPFRASVSASKNTFHQGPDPSSLTKVMSSKQRAHPLRSGMPQPKRGCWAESPSFILSWFISTSPHGCWL